MKYFVLNSSLKTVSQGEAVYTVKDGMIELPEPLAADLLASGEISKNKPAEEVVEVEAAPESVTDAKPKRKKKE